MLKRLTVCLAVIAACLTTMAPAPVHSAGTKRLAELSLEDLMNVQVYGASRFSQPVSKAPASVTVITRDDIRKYGYRNMAEIIRSVRGFQITYDRSYSYVGVRGFGRTGDYNTRILILVDGHRINENVYDSVYVGSDGFLDVDLIERVEFIRGPGSSLYGNNAFFGVVNIITRTAEKVKNVEIAASGGSFESVTGRVTAAATGRGNASAMVSGSFYDSDGDRTLYYPEFDDPAINGGIAHDIDKDKNYQLFGTFTWKELTLQGGYSGREKYIPTASYGAYFNDDRFEANDYRGYLDLKYEREGVEPTGLGVTARLFYDHYHYYAIIPWDLGIGGPVLNRDAAENNWWGSEIQLKRQLLDKHLLLGGVEFQQNLEQRFEAHDIDPFTQYIDLDHKTYKYAMFLQDEYQILERLHLNAGVRYDYFETFGSATSPRLAVVWLPTEKTSVKLIYGEAFRAPNNYELVYDVPASAYMMKGNRALKPEKIRNYEAVLEQQAGEHLKIVLSGFTSRISNLIQQVEDSSDGFMVFVNSAGATTRGGEAEIEGDWGNGFRGRVSFTYQEARDRETDAILANSPRQMAKANLIVPLLSERLFAGTELQYMGHRRTFYDGKAGSFVVVNLTLFSQEVLKGLDLSASVYNLFDKEYGDPGGEEHIQDIIRQDGRTYRLKATWRF